MSARQIRSVERAGHIPRAAAGSSYQCDLQPSLADASGFAGFAVNSERSTAGPCHNSRRGTSGGVMMVSEWVVDRDPAKCICIAVLRLAPESWQREQCMLADDWPARNIIVFIETITDRYSDAQSQSRSAPGFCGSRDTRQL